MAVAARKDPMSPLEPAPLTSVFNAASERARRRVLSRVGFKSFLWARLPLAAVAGLRIESLDESRCVVRLPGGWRTTNPFRSTYFAAQAMAAEMSTGAPAMVLVQGAPGSVSMLVREVHSVFTKKATGATSFTFADVGAMAAAVARAAQADEGQAFVARSTGRLGDGTVVAEFEIHWSFKRRA
jgi:hypothetical protein